MKKILIVLSLAFYACTHAFAQKQVGENLIEFELDDASGHKIIPLGDAGVLVYYMTESKAGKGLRVLQIDRFSTSLEKQKTMTANIPNNSTLIDYAIEGNTCYML